ncbi:AAA family ATPase [Devosia lacusdianchii]|uniref:AAA family ATPase n=1 Tax=Devosia lacusdianchii TaxID=2917991 RepID=UPI001F051B94|nr:AAA family ATPase [Devosia sp. JXJ CY 41]
MITHADNLFIITGGPGAGKTTLLTAAASAGICIGKEAARAIIQSQTAIDGPAVHWRDKALFAELMLDRDIQTFEALSSIAGPVLCDRGIPDLVAYAHMFPLAQDAHFRRAANLYRYNPIVFFAPPWREIFVTDAERVEGWEHAVSVYAPMRDVYAELGYRVVELPKAPVAERLAFVRDVIAHA